LGAPGGQVQDPTRYRLVEGSALIHIIDDVVVIAPLQGTYDLRPTDSPDQFLVENLRGFDSSGSQLVTGHGNYMFNYGYQRMVLQVLIGGLPYDLDSGWVPFETFLPMMTVHLYEVDPVSPEWYELQLTAVPALNVWFSTEVPFHTPSGQLISDGDVLSVFGARIWTNAQLTQNFHLQPPQDIGCDAIDPVEIDGPPWWRCFYSAEVDAYSGSQGWLQHGDFLSETGFIVARNWDLVQNFLPDFPVDYGLDAITWGWPCNGYYFSTEIDFWSNHMQGWCHHGDLLCQVDGWVYRRNQELLAKFQVLPPVQPDYGLDAVYLWWPYAHIWFSTEDGFQDYRFGGISDGDLLSTDGWVIYRNRDLVRRFEPVEDLDNFGLDALHVVPIRRGDMNGDSQIDGFDIQPFTIALVDSDRYYQMYPELNPNVVGDCNYDGVMDGFDIQPFVALLTGGK